jgi:hypothetical protein
LSYEQAQDEMSLIRKNMLKDNVWTLYNKTLQYTA